MKFYILLTLIFLTNIVNAQNSWKLNNSNSKTYQLETKALNEALKPLVNGQSKEILVTFPLPNDTFNTFKVSLNEVLSPALLKKFPNIHSFRGNSLNADAAITLTWNGSRFTISLIYNGQPWRFKCKKNNRYTLTKDGNAPPRDFNCTTDHKQVNTANKSLKTQNFYSPTFTPNNQLRTIRFAIAVTGETSDYFVNQASSQGASVAQRKADVLMGIANSIENINVALERDIGVRLQLIDNSDELIFLDKNTDPFSDINTTSTSIIASEANTYINNTIGINNFDLGHIITTPRNGAGGEAIIGGLCGNFKANAITASSRPEGFAFEFTLFAHEIGHQLGANHTQNANCQRNPTTSVEVSSGTTIMGYSGACGLLDVQNASDPFFHTISIDQILTTLNSRELFETNCVFQKEFLSNNIPQIELLPNDYYIPIGTPFFLDVVATDIDGDALTYSWEQLDTDVGPSPPEANSPFGPQFRILNPTQSSRRDFPANFVSTEYEVLPLVERNMSFNVLIRDGNPQGVAYSNVTSINTVGETAFTIALPLDSAGAQRNKFLQNETIRLRWAVGQTNQSLINTSNVRIDLINSVSGEDINLIENTANDGEQNVNFPFGFRGDNFRVKISAIDNIFYNVSNFFTISGIINNNTIITSEQTKSPNYLIFNIKKKETFVNESQIILTFTNEISGEVLNISTIGAEIALNGTNYEPLTTNKLSSIDFESSFLVRIPSNITDQAGNIVEKIKLELTIDDGTNISSISETRNIIPLDINFEDSIEIFPIPTLDGTVTIKSLFTLENDDLIEVSFIDVQGQLVKKTTISETEEQISVSELSSGLYFLQLIKNGNDVANFKILVQ